MANLYRFKQDFCAISQFGILANGGVSRIAFSKADHEARNYLIDKMRQANLQVSIDPAGNIRGLRNGSNPSLPAVMIGSHLDSVPQGGHYDGVVGVLAALEVIRALDDSGIKTLRSVEIVNFAAEESSRFGMATIGSKAITGKLSIDKMKEFRDSDGASLFQVLSNSGCQLENLESA
ncbi:MAG: Zn-dependent hydrolase, partial [Desulfobacteraceae bacterium 4572_35.1]